MIIVSAMGTIINYSLGWHDFAAAVDFISTLHALCMHLHVICISLTLAKDSELSASYTDPSPFLQHAFMLVQVSIIVIKLLTVQSHQLSSKINNTEALLIMQVHRTTVHAGTWEIQFLTCTLLAQSTNLQCYSLDSCQLILDIWNLLTSDPQCHFRGGLITANIIHGIMRGLLSRIMPCPRELPSHGVRCLPTLVAPVQRICEAQSRPDKLSPLGRHTYARHLWFRYERGGRERGCTIGLSGVLCTAISSLVGDVTMDLTG